METLREVLAGLSRGPFTDLFESDEAYLVVMDLPGATTETTDIEFETRRIHVEARRSKDVPSEFRYELEERPVLLDAHLPVPPNAVGSAARGSIDRGVLELRIPKTHTGDHEIEIE